MKINKWNEIDLDMFKDVFNMYWKKDLGTENKVLELQNLIAIREHCPEIRVYFGAKIRMEDFREFNKGSLEFIDIMREKFGSTFMMPSISMWIVTAGPRITPLGENRSHYDLIWSSCFGEKSDSEFINLIPNPIILWFSKTKDGNYETGDYANKNVPGSEKFVRLRGWDYEDWKKMMDTYCSNGLKLEDLYVEDDINKEKILYARQEHHPIITTS